VCILESYQTQTGSFSKWQTVTEMYTQQVTKRLWTDCQESIVNIAFPGDSKTEKFLTTAQRK
jgi:predicted alpha-1,6-mannanase (GH76 family)